MKRIFLIALFVVSCFFASVSFILSQPGRVSFAQLLAWIDKDEIKADMKSWINRRKLDFEVTDSRLSQIRAEWKKAKLLVMPDDMAQYILLCEALVR
jgi:hypothetical protein